MPLSVFAIRVLLLINIQSNIWLKKKNIMYIALWESLFIIYLISFFCNILYAVKRSHLVKGKLHFNFVPAINVLALSSKSFHYLLCSNGLGPLSILPLQQVQCQLRCWKSYCKKKSLLCYQRHSAPTIQTGYTVSLQAWTADTPPLTTLLKSSGGGHCALQT